MKYVKNLLIICSVIILTLIGFFFTSNLLKQPAWAASISWDGGGDAVSWSDDLNWSTDTVPTDVDDVLIDADVTVNLSAGTTVNSLVLGNSGGTTLPVLNFTYDSVGTTAPLIVDAGNLEIYSGGKITHSPGTSAVVGSVNIDIQTGDLIVHSGGSLDASEKGYSKRYGLGVGGSTSPAGGGGYGGEGGISSSDTVGGVTYGSIDNPIDLGSGGGGNSSYGGSGGGLIKINVGNNLDLSGDILANGGNGTSWQLYVGGPGSGGSINITVGNIWSGSGNIYSNGGDGDDYYGSSGGGGGGRIAIVGYSSKTYTGAITTYGGVSPEDYQDKKGKQGGSGTIFLKGNGEQGTLIVDNNTNTDRNLAGVTPISYIPTLDNLEISDYAYVDLDSNISTTNLNANTNSYIIGDTEITATDISILGSSYITLSDTVNVGTLEIDGAFLYVESTANVTYTTFNFLSGELGDGGGTFPYMEATDLSVPAGCTIYADTTRTYVDGLIDGTLTNSANDSTIEYKIDYTFSGNLIISDTGSINLTGKGYSGGNGPSPGTSGSNSNGAGGGAHGGNGGNGESGYLGGESYDIPNNPLDAGSGGANASSVKGGSGGGLLLLEVGGILDLQGSILSNGSNSGVSPSGSQYAAGGGAGGGINIVTSSFIGDGVIQANGGKGGKDAYNYYAWGGGGGGGLVLILYSESTFTGTAVATGGLKGGGAATNGEDGVVNITLSNQPPEASYLDISTPQNLYAGLSYSIDAIYSDPDGQDDISELYLKLQNPAGDDIELKATGSATDLVDQTAEVLTGSTYIETPKYSIYPTYGTANEIKVTWTFDIGWNWTETASLNYGVKTVDSAATSSSYSLTTDGFDYKKTLEFNSTGSLLVTNESGDPITSGSWLLPESTVNWTGYKVVYEGETDIYPNPDDYNIRLEDSTTRFWVDSGSEGNDFSLTTETLAETTTENIYTLTIVNLPTGGESTDSKNFTIKVDADSPTITSLLSTTHPNEESWYSENEVDVEWVVEDSHSGIDEMYTFVSSNSDESISTVENNGTLIAINELTTDTLEDGIHYIYLLITDAVGNQSLDSISVKIDSTVPDIVEVKGPYKGVWQNVDSGPPLTWSNPLSISGDIFYITTDGTTPSQSNFRYATNQTQYNILSLGEGEHIVNVTACNGANTCGIVRSFLVKYDSVSTSMVKNISTSLSSSNKVTINWSNPTESDFSKVIVVRKVGSASSTINDGTKIYEGPNNSFADSTLNSSTTYNYTIWAYDNVGNVSEKNSVSVTTLDLRAPGSVTNFKAILDGSNGVKLSWVNPEDRDFSGVLLYRDGVLIYEGKGKEYIDTLDKEGKYEYKIKAFDSSNNSSKEEIISYNFISPSTEEIVLVKEDSKSEKVIEGTKSKVKTGESVEIKIPVKKLMGDVELQDTDRIVLSISDVEYDLVLSEDKNYFSTKFIAPSTKGNHNISIRALREGDVLAQYDLEIEVVDHPESSNYESSNEQKDESSSYIYWVGGFILLLFTGTTIAFISKRKGKEA